MIDRFLLELLALGVIASIYVLTRLIGLKPTYQQFEVLAISLLIGALLLFATLI